MPASDTQIRSTFDRVKHPFTARPFSARGTYHARAEAGPGLTATATEGDRRFAVDMPEAVGGTGAAPTPGVYGRAALLGRLVISLRMEAINEPSAFRQRFVPRSRSIYSPRLPGSASPMAATPSAASS